MTRGWTWSPSWALAAVALACGGYFWGGASWNQNARLDAVYAFVEPGHPETGTFRIDRFMRVPDKVRNTGDWSLVDGHYYANKAPGTILLGVPCYALIYGVGSAVGLPQDDYRVENANAYLLNLLLSVVPLAVALVVWFQLLVARGASLRRAYALTLILFLGTPLFPYATQLWGHPLAAACVMFALAGVLRGTPRGLFWGGVACGIGVCTDMLLAPFALLLVAHQAHARGRGALPLVWGGAGPALALLAYQAFCFGSPFALATDSTNPQFVNDEALMGLFGAPSGNALWQMTVGQYRGLFVGSPVLLLAVPGFVYWLRKWKADTVGVLVLVAFLTHLLLVTCFEGWRGGWTVSPRYLIAALPLLGFALASLPETPAWGWALSGLTAYSMMNMFVIAMVSPLAPEWERNPLMGLGYRRLWRGELSPFPLPIRLQELDPAWSDYEMWGAWNLGELCGLEGVASALPLLLLVVPLLVFGWRATAVASDPATAPEAGPADPPE